LKIVVLKINIF